ncbi:hypothetical protein [Jiangella alkaliphila]|uniref:Uncharacterized protein n=1 Tax=Jiangella alkaliphila TaxID=419479 RepID=A0A1H2IG55_9ACTN|nr:hypothetical protein [Jiangella alkaliphila]SDU42936.1 hypothetical protein SAMN04488563_1681 [Jiangella alkaliphila]
MTTIAQSTAGVSLGDLQTVLTYLADRPLLPMPDDVRVYRYKDPWLYVHLTFDVSGRAAFDAWVAELGEDDHVKERESEHSRGASVTGVTVKARGRREIRLTLSWYRPHDDDTAAASNSPGVEG